MFWQEVHQLDQQLTLTINGWHSSFTDPIWAFFSDKIVWIPMYAAIVALLIWKLGWKKGLIVIAAAGLTFGFCDQFSNLVKDLVARVRPLNDEFMIANGLNVLEKGSRSFSFFSAHAANAFGLATSTIIGLKLDTRLFPITGTSSNWGKAYICWMYLWAGLVAISRIFVGKHYLGDVLAGAIIGTAAGFVFSYSAILIIRKTNL